MAPIRRMAGRQNAFVFAYALARRWHPCASSRMLSNSHHPQGQIATALGKHVSIAADANTTTTPPAAEVVASPARENTNSSSLAERRGAGYAAARGGPHLCGRGYTTRRRHLKQSRGFGNDATSDPNRNVTAGSSTAFDAYATGKTSMGRALKDYSAQFMRGTRVLWAEVKQARKLAAVQKEGGVITFQEERLVRQVWRDVAKAFPVVAVFAVPFAGYISPAMGFLFPKALLPAQFWTSPQRMDYMLEDALHQEMSLFPAVLRCLAVLDFPPRPNSTPGHLRHAVGWFAEQGRLEHLSRQHLLRLVQSCNTMPTMKKVSARLAPKSVLIRWLREEVKSISQDDLALLRVLDSGGALEVNDGVEGKPAPEKGDHGRRFALSPDEIALLCWERGLLRSQHWSRRDRTWSGNDLRMSTAAARTMLDSLRDWLSLYDATRQPSADTTVDSLDEGDSNSASATANVLRDALPPSMLLHAPALLRLPMSASVDSPVCHWRTAVTVADVGVRD